MSSNTQGIHLSYKKIEGNSFDIKITWVQIAMPVSKKSNLTSTESFSTKISSGKFKFLLAART